MSNVETIKTECRHCGVINAVALTYHDDVWRWPADGDKKAKAWFLARVSAMTIGIAGGVVLMAVGALAILIALVLK